MDKPEAISPALPQLEYAPQPSVGDLTLSRRDGVLTVQVRAGWRRVFRASWALIWCFLLLLLLGAWQITADSFAHLRNNPGVLGVIALGTVSVIAGSVKAILFTLSGHKWIVIPNQLEFRGRRMTSIFSEVYARNRIADLTVERIRLKDGLWKRRSLIIIKPDGNKIAILFGTRAELDFARQAFKETLGIPPDPLGDSEYPKLARWSPLKRRLTLDGIVFTIFPPPVGWDGALMIALVLSVSLGVDYWIEHLDPDLANPLGVSLIGVIRALLCGLLILAIALYARHKLRKAITLGWTGGFVHLNERSLLSPCAEKWPADQVASFVVQPVGPRRSHLFMKLKDASTVPLIQNGKTTDVQLAFEMLSTAVRRQRTPTPVMA